MRWSLLRLACEMPEYYELQYLVKIIVYTIGYNNNNNNEYD